MNVKIRDAVDSATIVHFSGLFMSKWAAIFLQSAVTEPVNVREAVGLATITFITTVVVCMVATNFVCCRKHNETLAARVVTIFLTALLAGAGTFTGITGIHDITEGVVFSVACLHIMDILCSGLLAGIRICTIPFATLSGIIGCIVGCAVTTYTFSLRTLSGKYD